MVIELRSVIDVCLEPYCLIIKELRRISERSADYIPCRRGPCSSPCPQVSSGSDCGIGGSQDASCLHYSSDGCLLNTVLISYLAMFTHQDIQASPSALSPVPLLFESAYLYVSLSTVCCNSWFDSCNCWICL